MPEDAQIAESSPATAPVATPAPASEPAAEASYKLSDWSPAEQKDYMETGKLPPSHKPTKQADAAPASAETADSSEKPAGEAAAPKQPKPKSNADDRVQQVLRERYRERSEAQAKEAALQARIRELEAAPKAQPQQAAPKPVTDELAMPDESDYETLGDYRKALAKYYDELSDRKIEAHEKRRTDRQAAEARQQYEAEVMTGWETRLADTFGEDQGELNAVVAAGEAVHTNPTISEFIMTDDLGPQIAAYLGRNLRKAQDLMRITSPGKLIAALADLKNEVRAGSSASPKVEPKPVLMPSKQVSQAPAPPSQLSTSATAPHDEVLAAIESFSGGNANAAGDYIARMNARELKARRG